MDVFNAIRTRRTIRDFTDAPVSDAVLHKILQAARWAPSSSNTQPWHFIVVRDSDTIKQLGEICTQGSFIGKSQVAIAIVMDGARRAQLDAGRPCNRWSWWPGRRGWEPVSSASVARPRTR